MISIITPTYNRRDYLTETIESVLNQTYTNFEHLIVDDGSKDDTAAIVKAYQEYDKRVHYFYQCNQGQSIARNFALNKAKGDFVCFLDSDDFWIPEKIEKQLEAFRKYPEVDVVYGDCLTIDSQSNIISKKNMKRHSGKITALLLRDNFVSMSTTMVRKRCFDEMGGMSTRWRVADDYELWLRLSTKYFFYYLPEYLTYYRISEQQISSDTLQRLRVNKSIIIDFLANYPYAVTPRELKENLSRFYARMARCHSRAGDRKNALYAFFTAFTYKPCSTLVWRALYRMLFPSRYTMKVGTKIKRSS